MPAHVALPGKKYKEKMSVPFWMTFYHNENIAGADKSLLLLQSFDVKLNVNCILIILSYLEYMLKTEWIKVLYNKVNQGYIHTADLNAHFQCFA